MSTHTRYDTDERADPSADALALELTGISKAFGAVQALLDVDLRCRAGEVHALVGENGAGKSTLIKVASGIVTPDRGTVRIGGHDLRHASAAESRRLGLLTAYQDTSLISELSVAENLLLSFHAVRPLGVRLSLDHVAELLAPYELPFGADDRVGDLSPASRQLLEVVKALVHRPRVLLLDEPTAALDGAGAKRLLTLLRQAVGEGTAILYISHRLDEVREIADRLTVIRDGQSQGTYEGQGWEVGEIVAEMVGVPTSLAFPPKTGADPKAEERLRLASFRGPGFGPVDLSVHAGEVVGVAGADGNGQRELLRSLVGLRGSDGDLFLDGDGVTIGSPRVARSNRIMFLSGDRAVESIFAELSVMDNATVGLSHELGPAGLVLRSRERGDFDRVADELHIVRASPDQPVRELSGGNQQKTVMSRCLLKPATLLALEDPTQGVDARARLDIYRVIRAEADSGAAILLSSSDSAELAGLCDRVYVMSRGRVVDELVGDEVTEDRIVQSFVNVTTGDGGDVGATGESRRARSGLASRLPKGGTTLPLVVLVALIGLLGAYATAQSPDFLTPDNMSSLLILALPLSIVALGEQAALLVAEFDISIGSAISLGVVVTSFVATSNSLVGALPGVVLLIVIGVAIGAVNSFLVRALKINPIVATIATLGILSGIAIMLRPEPGGLIGLGITDLLTAEIGFVPVAFVVVVVAAVAADAWRTRTSWGLTVRAAGFNEEASRRIGIRVTRIKVGAYVMCSTLAVIAGLVLSTQIGVGENSVGAGFPLIAFTACFLGGAALSGGRGSFVGTILGALFLSLLTNISPLTDLPEATVAILTGAMTLIAVTAYSEKLTGLAGLRRAIRGVLTHDPR